LRPARVLIGWMDPEEAALTLAGRQSGDAARPEHQLRVGQARTVAGARRPVLEVAGVVTEPPASFHGEAFPFRTARGEVDRISTI
jgi:hypothetical protein